MRWPRPFTRKEKPAESPGQKSPGLKSLGQRSHSKQSPVRYSTPNTPGERAPQTQYEARPADDVDNTNAPDIRPDEPSHRQGPASLPPILPAIRENSQSQLTTGPSHQLVNNRSQHSTGPAPASNGGARDSVQSGSPPKNRWSRGEPGHHGTSSAEDKSFRLSIGSSVSNQPAAVATDFTSGALQGRSGHIPYTPDPAFIASAATKPSAVKPAATRPVVTGPAANGIVANDCCVTGPNVTQASDAPSRDTSATPRHSKRPASVEILGSKSNKRSCSNKRMVVLTADGNYVWRKILSAGDTHLMYRCFFEAADGSCEYAGGNDINAVKYLKPSLRYLRMLIVVRDHVAVQHGLKCPNCGARIRTDKKFTDHGWLDPMAALTVLNTYESRTSFILP